MSEKERVLKMVEEGKINAVEALKLLEALGDQIKESKETFGEVVRVRKEEDFVERGKFLRIKITSNAENLNFTIPLALVSMGLNMANQFGVDVNKVEGLKQVNFDEIIKQIEEGAMGKIVDIKTETESIEIFIE